MLMFRSLVDEYRLNEEASTKRKQKLEEEMALLKKEVNKKSIEITNIRRSAMERTEPVPSNVSPVGYTLILYSHP